MPSVVLRESGQWVAGPNGVAAQSKARVSDASSPPQDRNWVM